MTGWKPLWPCMTASSICISGSSLASDSTIMTASAVPATTRSRSLLAISSIMGLSTSFAIDQPDAGGADRAEEGYARQVSAAEAATIATISGSFSISCDSTVTTTCVSCLKPSTNRVGSAGRSGAKSASPFPSGDLRA